MPLICENYQFLHFREGVVELALRCASEVDPANHAVAWFRSAYVYFIPNMTYFKLTFCFKKRREDDDSVGKKAFDIRHEMYTYVISVFDELWAGIPPKFNYLPPEEVVPI